MYRESERIAPPPGVGCPIGFDPFDQCRIATNQGRARSFTTITPTTRHVTWIDAEDAMLHADRPPEQFVGDHRQSDCRHGLCRRPGCRRGPRPRSIVRSRCAISRSSNLHQIGSTRYCSKPGSRGGRREAYISAKHPQTCQEARVSLPHEHPRRACRAQEPSRQGPRPSLRLIGRIRERQAFARIGREGTRIRRSALWCSWCPDPDSTTTSVAFAVTRAYGPAVTRNRLRRRLRAILRILDRIEPLPPVMILIGARPSAIELTFDQLKRELSAMIQQIRSQTALELEPKP